MDTSSIWRDGENDSMTRLLHSRKIQGLLKSDGLTLKGKLILYYDVIYILSTRLSYLADTNDLLQISLSLTSFFLVLRIHTGWSNGPTGNATCCQET